GDPFRSDAYYYWIQNYIAARSGVDLEHYWRSLAPPPSLGEILKTDAGGLLLYTLRGVPTFIYSGITQATIWSKPAAVLLGLALAIGYLRFRRWGTAEFQAAAIIALCSAAALMVRAATLEIRYINFVCSLILLGALLPLCDGWRKSRWTQALALVWIL